MNPQHILKVVLGVSLVSLGSAVAADDVDSILKQISGESSGNAGSGGKNTSLKKSSSSDSATSRKKSTQASVPSIKIWNPKDKLPQDISGQGVAGNFAIYGTSSEGNPILIPAEDAANPFARQYWIVNLRENTGRTLVPIGQRQMVQVSARRPLIFVGRGILPGVYNVQVQ